MKAIIQLKPGALEDHPTARNLTQSELAEHIGVTRQTVRRALEGAPVSAEFVARVSLALGTSFESLFETAYVPDRVAA